MSWPTRRAPSPWSSIPTELAGVVFCRLPRHVDRVRFAAVCRQWRASARHIALPQHYPWLALPERTFYSLPSSAFRPLPLHLDRHQQLPHAQSSCGEWLVFERFDGAYTLVSPFSMSTTIVLPGLSDAYAPNVPLRVAHDEPVPNMLKLVVCSGDLVAAIVDDEGWTFSKLALCRPGASSWHVRAHDRLRRLQDMVWCKGKLYVLADEGWTYSKLALCRPGASSWWSRTPDQLRHLQDMVSCEGKLYALDSFNGLFSVSVGRNRRTGEPTVSRVEHLMGSPSEVLEDSPRYLLRIQRHVVVGLQGGS